LSKVGSSVPIVFLHFLDADGLSTSKPRRKSFIHRVPVQNACKSLYLGHLRISKGGVGSAHFFRGFTRHQAPVTGHKSLFFSDLPPLTPLFAASRHPASFVFSKLQPLFAKAGGWGTDKLIPRGSAKPCSSRRQATCESRFSRLESRLSSRQVPLPQEDARDSLEA
jgi:hypothetical protein